MAKISARGAREVARWEAYIRGAADEHGPAYCYRYLIVLTSDGRVLRRAADGGSYSILATFKRETPPAGTPAPSPAELVELRKARVERFLARRRYVDVARQAVRA